MPEDSTAALALAMEEADTCRSCGYPKAWCRDPKRPFTDYEVHEETCQATLRLAHFREGDKWKSRHEPSKQATQMWPRFREGRAPDLAAGLNTDD